MLTYLYNLIMCVAFPGKIKKIYKDGFADIEFNGNIVKANIKLVDVKVGDYVLVHAGYATTKINKEDAKDILDAFLEI